MPVEAARERLLTVPDVVPPGLPYVPTGNEYVALPEIDPARAAVHSANVLHMGARGLVEFRGRPLCAPVVELDGNPVGDLHFGRVEFVEHFIPRLTAQVGAHRLAVTYFAPPECKGWVALLEFTHGGGRALDVTLGLAGAVEETALCIFSRRSLHGGHRGYWNSWSKAAVWEVHAGMPLAALALRDAAGSRPLLAPDPVWSREAGGGEVALPSRYRLVRTVRLAPGETVNVPFFWGVAGEGDGAGLMAVDLARHGWQALLDHTRTYLAARAWPAQGHPAAATYHRNLFFCLFFASGKTIDTEERVLVTSRSPRYYVCAAHWTRDSLLWAFPAVLQADPGLAREWLCAAFRLYTKNPGVHAQYLDGTVLYPGFELDQLCAFYLALGSYVRATEDLSILAEPAVASALPRLERTLERWRDPATGLGRTFLLPSDDPAQYPYVTYDNALLWAAFQAMADLARRRGDAAAAARAEAEARRVREAVFRHCVVPGPYGPMFCWATDLRGNHVLYDEPPGSLELLPLYGFVDRDDPVYANTVRWIHSRHNPYGPGDGRFATPSCPHAPYAWTLSVAGGLLCGRREWLERLPLLPLDAGLACETFDPETGELRTGAAFATCAGFLAFAVRTAAGDARR